MFEASETGQQLMKAMCAIAALSTDKDRIAELAEMRLLNIADGIGYHYSYEVLAEAVSQAIADIRALKGTTDAH